MSPCITHSPQIYMMDFLPTGDTVLWHVAGQEILISLSHSWLQHTMSCAAVQGFSCLFCSTLSLMSWLHLLGFFFGTFCTFCLCVLFCFTVLYWNVSWRSSEHRAEIYKSWTLRQLFGMETISLQSLTVDFKQTSLSIYTTPLTVAPLHVNLADIFTRSTKGAAEASS